MKAKPLEDGVAEEIDSGKINARDDFKIRARYMAVCFLSLSLWFQVC